MSSSGLIYAMIVGAWAAYLVPMWLRRQDELNEARPTERFSTAIRLLTGRRPAEAHDDEDLDAAVPPAAGGVVDVRAAAMPATERHPAPAAPEAPHRDPTPEGPDSAPRTNSAPGSASPHSSAPPAAPERRARAMVLARRRRTTTLLFLALTAGAIVAAVAGLRYLWAALVPAVLLIAYLLRVRTQERRRYAVTVDQPRAEAAARRLRERRALEQRRPAAEAAADEPAEGLHDRDPEPSPTPYEADRRALVEQTDHAEWVDQQRERARGTGQSWDPVPVPLPTYVTAPVAPRANPGLDLEAPDTWSSARSSTAEPTHTEPPGSTPAQAAPTTPEPEARRPRRSRDRSRTPLFDQYADPDRPRAANE